MAYLFLVLRNIFLCVTIALLFIGCCAGWLGLWGGILGQAWLQWWGWAKWGWVHLLFFWLVCRWWRIIFLIGLLLSFALLA